MRRGVKLFFAFVCIFMFGSCILKIDNITKSKKLERNACYKSDMVFDLSLQSSVEKEKCFICGTPAGGLLDYYYKFDSIGIIHWADLSVADIEIQKFDTNGSENTEVGTTSTRSISFGEKYGSIYNQSWAERRISETKIYLGEKDELDYNLLTNQLCQTCLDKVCEFYEDQVNNGRQEYLETTGYCLIDFTTKELYTLSEPYRGYSIRDYMVRYDFKEQSDGEKYIDVLIFYAPIWED